MAAPLGQVVFKVPELGETGYKLQVADEARAEKKAQQRDREVYRTGGEKAYSDNVYKLQGRYKDDVELLYNELEKYGEKYEMTGDASALRMVSQISGQIKGVVDDYNTNVGLAVKNASKADNVSWEGFVGDRESFDQQLANVINPSEVTGRKFENGQLLYQINGEFVPKTQTAYGTGKPNAKNTVMVQPASEMGKYAVPAYFESKHPYLSINAASVEGAQTAIINEFRYEIADDADLQADVAVAYAISQKRLDPNKISVSEMNKIVSRFKNDPEYQKQALDFYEGRLKKISSNRWSAQSKQSFGQEEMAERPVIGGQPASVDSEEPVKEQNSASVPSIPDINEDELPVMPADKKKETAKEEVAPSTPEQPKNEVDNAGKVVGPRPANRILDEGVGQVREKVKEIEGEELDIASEEEEFDPNFGISENRIDVVRVAKGENGKRDVVSIERTLPEIYTNNLLKYEGGTSSDQSDPAYADNPDAPVVNGKRIHTNIGVTWNVYKSWAKAFGIPEADMESRFLNLKPNEALAVAEHIATSKGSNNFKNPALVGLFTQNAWGGGAVLGKTTGSPEYQATISMLEANGINLSSKHKITKEDAAKIEELYDKNPKKFLDDYFDAYMISHSRMDKMVKDEKGYAGFGKGAMVPLYMVYRNGWMNRANELKQSMAKNAGVEYTPVTPYNETRKYEKYKIAGKTKWRLVEKRGDEWKPVGRRDWVDSLEPIE